MIDVKSPELLKNFLRDGYLHLHNFINPRDCERLIFRMHDLAAKHCPKEKAHVFLAGEDTQSTDDFFLSSAHKIAFFFDKNAVPKDVQHKSNFHALNKVGHALHNLCPVYRKFSHQKKFYDLSTALGLKKPMLVQSMFIFKHARFGDAVPAHQDGTFLYTEPDSVLGLWFALEDATIANGCLWVLKGGHRGKLKSRFLRQPSGFQFDFNQRVDWPRKKFEPIEAKKGDVIVLHSKLPHLSEQNRSEKTRFAYTLHFIDRRCHYPKTNWLDISSNFVPR